MKPKKIAFIVRVIPPSINGVGDYTMHLVEALRGQGLDARIFTEVGQNVDLKNKDFIYPVVTKWGGAGILDALRAQTTFTPDWLCLQYVPQMYGKSGVCPEMTKAFFGLKRQLNVKIAITFHEIIAPWSWNPLRASLAVMTRWQAKQLLSDVDLAITTCEPYADIVRRLSPWGLPVEVIPVGPGIKGVAVPEQTVGLLREQYDLEGVKVLGMFGRMTAERDFSIGVDILERIKDSKKFKIKILLMGDVETSNPKMFRSFMEDARKRGLQDQIIVTGKLSPFEISAHFKLMNVFLFPQVEGVSTRNTSVVSAMAHHLPIVTFEPQKNALSGYKIPTARMIPRGQREAFIHAAIEMLEMPTTTVLEKQNADYFDQNFSWKILGKKYSKAFSEVKMSPGGRN